MHLYFCGKGEVKACAARRVVDRPQAAAMRFNDGTADPKSHPGPLRLGGKERIKDLIRLLRREPHAGIADREHELAVLGLQRADDRLASEFDEIAGWTKNGMSHYVDVSDLAAGMNDSIVQLEFRFFTPCCLGRFPNSEVIIR